MSDRKPSAFINDMLKSVERIGVYASDITFEEFSSNYMIIEACLYNIQIIGVR